MGIIVVILAGGRATRMGGADKALLPLAGMALLDHVLIRMAGQGAGVILNANGDPARLARFDCPVVPDTVPGHPGPLAGVLAGMEWAASVAPDTSDIVTVPADTPLVPRDLVQALVAARDAAGAELACAHSAGRDHPVVGLWPVRLAAVLRQALVEERLHRVRGWAGRFKLARAVYAAGGLDPFANINTLHDLAAMEARLAMAAG